MRKMKKVIALLVVAVMMFSLAACGSSESKDTSGSKAAAGSTAKPADKKIVIGMTLYSLKNEFTVRLSNAAKKEAEKLGVELKIYDGNYDPNTQINQVETMISDGVDAIILNPQDAKACAVAVDKAAAKNIPVIGVNTRVDSDKLTSYVGSKDVYAG